MMKRNLHLTLITIVAALLFVLAPSQMALAQLEIDPPLDCVSPSGGDCASGGCAACEGPSCIFIDGIDTFQLTTSVDTDLSCDGSGNVECDEENCDSSTDTLRATGRVTMTRLQGSGGWGHDVIVCEGIFLCSNPGQACVHCEVVELTNGSNSSHQMNELVCNDAPDGQ